MSEVDPLSSLVRSEPRTIAEILPTLMGNKCALDDDSVRAAIERESGKIVARMEKMPTGSIKGSGEGASAQTRHLSTKAACDPQPRRSD